MALIWHSYMFCLFDRFAKMYHLNKLREGALGLMRSRFKDVVHGPEFKQLNTEDLIEYISGMHSVFFICFLFFCFFFLLVRVSILLIPNFSLSSCEQLLPRRIYMTSWRWLQLWRGFKLHHHIMRPLQKGRPSTSRHFRGKTLKSSLTWAH